MPVTLSRDGEDFLAVDLRTCRGGEFKEALDKVRDIPGRKYDPERKLWLLPAEAAVAQKAIVALSPIINDTELETWIKDAAAEATAELATKLPDDVELAIPWATDRAPWQPQELSLGEERTPFKGLMKHQRPVVDLAAQQKRLLICDDQGLGKCAMSLSGFAEYVLRDSSNTGSVENASSFRSVAIHPEYQKPKLVVCPNSVKGTWEREIKMWLGEEAAVIEGSNAKARQRRLEEAIDNNCWVIVNWEQLQIQKKKIKLRNGGTKTTKEMKQPLFEKTEWGAVIGDEVHRAKNRKALTSQGLWRVTAPFMAGLSGTPLMNDPSELWSVLRWLWPNDYHEAGRRHSPAARAFWAFYDEYVDYTEGYFGKEVNGVRNPDALRLELKDRLVRRTKGQVLDLPPKHRIYVPLTLNTKQAKLYADAEKAMWLEIEQEAKQGDTDAQRFIKKAAEGASREELLKIPNGAARTVRLRQIIESPALLGGPDDSAVLDSCVDKIMDSRPEQWIVFTEFRETTNLLKERLRKKKLKAETFTGEVDSHERGELEQRFQDGDVDVLIGTIKAMNSGITLTAGNNQYWVSRDWVPAINEQGEDRQHRISQTDTVSVFIAQPDNTVAVSKITPTNKAKEHIVESVIEKDTIKEATE